MDLERLLNDYEQALKAAGFSDNSIFQYPSAIKNLSEKHGLDSISADKVEDLYKEYKKGGAFYDPNSNGNDRAALKHLIEYYKDGKVNKSRNDKTVSSKSSQKSTSDGKISINRVDQGRTAFPRKLRSFNIDTLMDWYPTSNEHKIVQYEEGVEDYEKIPGLVKLTYTEYESVIGHLNHLKLLPHFENWIYFNQEKIQIILSPRKVTKTYGKPFDQAELKKLIKHAKDNNIDSIAVTELEKLFNSITDVITGEFVHNDSQLIIYIYYRVLDNTDIYAYIASLVQTIAHEVLHMAHYLANPEYFEQNSNKANRVKEAVADFYSMLYLLYGNAPSNSVSLIAPYKDVLAEKRYNLWLERYDDNWPYSYALWLMMVAGKKLSFSHQYEKYIDHGCVIKLKRVIYAQDNIDPYDILTEKSISSFLSSSTPTSSGISKISNSSLPPFAMGVITRNHVMPDDSDMNAKAALKKEINKELGISNNADEKTIELAIEEYFESETKKELVKDVPKRRNLVPIYIWEILEAGKTQQEWYSIEKIKDELNYKYGIIVSNKADKHSLLKDETITEDTLVTKLNTLAASNKFGIYRKVVYSNNGTNEVLYKYCSKVPADCSTNEVVDKNNEEDLTCLYIWMLLYEHKGTPFTKKGIIERLAEEDRFDFALSSSTAARYINALICYDQDPHNPIYSNHGDPMLIVMLNGESKTPFKRMSQIDYDKLYGLWNIEKE